MKGKILLLFFFFCAITVAEVHAHVSITNPAGGEKFTPGNTITVQWKEIIDHGENDWDIYYSLDGGEVWEVMAIDIEEYINEYQWDIPIAMTSQAQVKVIQDNKGDANYETVSNYFSITTETQGGGGETVITDLVDDINFGNELLISNFPNPFADHTTIRFILPEPHQVQLSIYTIQGNMVYFEPKHLLFAGTYNLTWENNALTDGIYICNLKTAEQSISTRMILRH